MYYKNNKLTGIARSNELFTQLESEWGFKKFIEKKTVLANQLGNHMFIECIINSKIKMDRLK